MNHTVDIAGTGFTVLDRLYADERKVRETLGGSCGNVLLSLAHLNRRVAPLLKFGCDSVGEVLFNEFASAGADTRYISRQYDIETAVLAQHLETSSAQHYFSFICPETERSLPRPQLIDEHVVNSARTVLRECSVFYTDRISHAILEAIETAASAGAIVFFEPSKIDDIELFSKALQFSHVVKISSDRLDLPHVESALEADTILIITHGARGLELRHRDHDYWCNALPARRVKDTCGSGDMVSVGLIDWLLTHNVNRAAPWNIDAFRRGVVAGQRLAAANCAFEGARGLFHKRGPLFARQILESEDFFDQFDFFDELDKA